MRVRFPSPAPSNKARSGQARPPSILIRQGPGARFVPHGRQLMRPAPGVPAGHPGLCGPHGPTPRRHRCRDRPGTSQRTARHRAGPRGCRTPGHRRHQPATPGRAGNHASPAGRSRRHPARRPRPGPGSRRIARVRADAQRERDELHTATNARLAALEDTRAALRIRAERAETNLDTARAELARLKTKAPHGSMHSPRATHDGDPG
jgi:hypothetical protein